jgi:hypothetical protein
MPKMKVTKKTKKTVTNGNRLPRGYKVKRVIRELNLPETMGGMDTYELWEVSGVKVDRPRVFISEETARAFVDKCETIHAQVKALVGKGHAPIGMRDVMKNTADMAASAEMAGACNGPKSDRRESKVMYSDSE